MTPHEEKYDGFKKYLLKNGFMKDNETMDIEAPMFVTAILYDEYKKEEDDCFVFKNSK